MKFTQVQLAALVAGVAFAQTLNIPSRAGSIVSLPEPSVITGSEDFGNEEFDRGQPCDSDEDTGSENAVFVLEDGASISNVIIGADSLEGVHCLGTFLLEPPSPVTHITKGPARSPTSGSVTFVKTPSRF